MSYTFTGSIPTKGQIEKLRLVLSTFQDGTGQLVFEPGKSLPGWRDFERSVALAFDGLAQESKAIFDVLVPISPNQKINYGISCKMRQTLQTVEKTGRVTVEVSNSAGKFWDGLRARGIDDYNTDPNTNVIKLRLYPLVGEAEAIALKEQRTLKRPILARRALPFQHDGFSLVLT